MVIHNMYSVLDAMQARNSRVAAVRRLTRPTVTAAIHHYLFIMLRERSIFSEQETLTGRPACWRAETNGWKTASLDELSTEDESVQIISLSKAGKTARFGTP